ncbi:MAG: hypothetical protein US13_C0001G0163 [candidate division TM6 bacterium GW2011_GWE2_36_25]|nr:MAG: hypothetical protein US03_C0001G0041 [candidate division TM6 bacterium GW2011_GWF2_36_131]KKQ03823.1 MAG: hypothetical protein US13_C0001G0163 [candidate division TM6 bacterium GW2011_GWE2_36_25]KKQ19969.1 MAG: hypothetical protein US32_C0003G0086 [candidate division TM6 bacterium GW2011_GWA2_36_9]
MKIYWILFTVVSFMNAFGDPIIFRPFHGACAQSLNKCFNTCFKNSLNLSLCPGKKPCLDRCNFKLIKSMRPEKCYAECDKIPCHSLADCTTNCFKKTPEGICREQCRDATKNCTKSCPSTTSDERFPCLNCCYDHGLSCSKKCCNIT